MKSNDEFCEKVRLCENAMYKLAFSILKNDADVADAISEAVLKAFSNLNSLKNSSSFKPWILKILHNTCIEMLRKRIDTVNIDEQYELVDSFAVTDTSTKMVLKSAVDKLNQPYCTVITLYYYEQLSILQISNITGSSVMAVKKQLSRARNMLKETLNKEDFFE